MFSNFRKEEPVKIRFLFDGDQASWQDLKIFGHIQKGTADPDEIQLLMAHFLVDDKNQFMTEEKAIKALDKLKNPEIAEVTARFIEAMNDASIPKASGTPLNSPSDPGQAGTSLNGSES